MTLKQIGGGGGKVLCLQEEQQLLNSYDLPTKRRPN